VTTSESGSPGVFIRRSTPLRSTVVLDTYWQFAAKRQEVYFARLRQAAPPWTTDPIISTYKFTNTYRAADRVSQFLIRHVIYQSQIDSSPEDTLFRILLFKVFNKIETWQLLEEHLGSITFKSYRFDAYDRVLSQAMATENAIYSAAYIMPSAGVLGHKRKHRNHLALLETMIRDGLASKLGRAKTMSDAYALMRSYPSIGNFLAYQFTTDINYSELTDFSEAEFVIPGPGAIDGIRKTFTDTGGLADADVIRLIADIQEEEFSRRGLPFKNLFGRRLQYIDCQNLFCEVDKYARVAHPNYAGRSNRTRIKQRFSETGPLSAPLFPPKWNINHRVAASAQPEPL
jgi:hypothetical protein